MRFLIVLLLLCVSLFGEAIKAYALNPPLSLMLYIVSPESMIGLTYKPYKEDLTYLLEEVRELPVIGMLGGGKELNFEMLISKKPEVVFASSYAKMDEFEAKLKQFGIKLVYLDYSNLREALDSMVIMGEHLNKKERVLKLKAEALKLLDSLEKKEPKYRPSVYFAQGMNGMESECGDESENDVAKAIGARNVISCDGLSAMNRITINIERLIQSDPEVIFVREVPFYNTLISNPPKQWKNISAVKSNRIYYAPSSPSNWLSRPPSLMRVLGFYWAYDLLHKDEGKEDIKAVIKDFYAQFLHRPNLSDDDIEILLRGE